MREELHVTTKVYMKKAVMLWMFTRSCYLLPLLQVGAIISSKSTYPQAKHHISRDYPRSGIKCQGDALSQ